MGMVFSSREKREGSLPTEEKPGAPQGLEAVSQPLGEMSEVAVHMTDETVEGANSQHQEPEDLTQAADEVSEVAMNTPEEANVAQPQPFDPDALDEVSEVAVNTPEEANVAQSQPFDPYALDGVSEEAGRISYDITAEAELQPMEQEGVSHPIDEMSTKVKSVSDKADAANSQPHQPEDVSHRLDETSKVPTNMPRIQPVPGAAALSRSSSDTSRPAKGLVSGLDRCSSEPAPACLFQSQIQTESHEGLAAKKVLIYTKTSPVTWAEAIHLLADDSHEGRDFRQALLSALQHPELHSAYFWECRPLTAATSQEAFEFVVLEAPELLYAQANPAPFMEHLSAKPDNSALHFQNLGGDATLVVPAFPGSETASLDCVHLAAFLRSKDVTVLQKEKLWMELGQVLLRHLQQPEPAPVWVATDGRGVSWVHLRLDSYPKYTKWEPYRSLGAAAETVFEVVKEESGGAFKAEFYKGSWPLTWGEAVDLLVDGAPAGESFRKLLSSILQRSGLPKAFFWECSPVSSQRSQQPFEFVILPAPDLEFATSDRRPFREHFKGVPSDVVVSFENLGRDAVLVVPSLPSSDAAYSACVHIAAYFRSSEVQEQQKDLLWRELGKALQARLDQGPVWVGTDGRGVSWLHLRLDKRPKYTKWGSYRS